MRSLCFRGINFRTRSSTSYLQTCQRLNLSTYQNIVQNGVKKKSAPKKYIKVTNWHFFLNLQNVEKMRETI